MKKLVLLAVLAFACSALAQDGIYQLNYYSNRNNSAGADQFFRIVNDGFLGSPMSPNHGYICADLYVFDAGQEMIECCSCPISANGLLTLSVLGDLTANPLTGFPAPSNGVIKLVGDNRSAGGSCGSNASTLSIANAAALTVGLHSWGTHIQAPVAGTFVTTETRSDPGAINPGSAAPNEIDFLGTACSFVQFLGSGKGTCTCGTGGRFGT